MNRSPVASAKPNRPFIFIGNRKVAYYYIFKKEWREGDLIIPLIKRRYKKTIQLFRNDIDAMLEEMGIPIPEYKDSQVTDILLCIKKMKLEDKQKLQTFLASLPKT